MPTPMKVCPTCQSPAPTNAFKCLSCGHNFLLAPASAAQQPKLSVPRLRKTFSVPAWAAMLIILLLICVGGLLHQMYRNSDVMHYSEEVHFRGDERIIFGPSGDRQFDTSNWNAGDWERYHARLDAFDRPNQETNSRTDVQIEHDAVYKMTHSSQ